MTEKHDFAAMTLDELRDMARAIEREIISRQDADDRDIPFTLDSDLDNLRWFDENVVKKIETERDK